MEIRSVIHLLLHFIVPALVAWGLVKEKRVKAWIIMVATMVVDLDHLLATPIYDQYRCGINFHPLHSYWAIALYFVLLYPKKTRLIGAGLCIHMVLDFTDCLWINNF